MDPEKKRQDYVEECHLICLTILNWENLVDVLVFLLGEGYLYHSSVDS